VKNDRQQTILIDAARPLARKDGLVIEELDGETLIYDTERDKAHCLNSAAAQIWRHCDGRHTLADIRDDFADDMPIEVAQEVVSDCVLRLSRARLLEEDSLPSKGNLVLSRRNLLRKIGIGAASAAIVLPLVTSIVAPTPAAAASCGSYSCHAPHFTCPFFGGCICNRGGRCVPFG
jgi:hypothetical protein